RGFEPPHAHRKPDQARALGPPRKLHLVDLALERGVEVTAVAGDDLPAAALEAMHGLAKLAYGAPLQRESGRVDDGLLADAERPEAHPAIARQVAARRAPQRDPPAVSPRVGQKLAQHERHRLV